MDAMRGVILRGIHRVLRDFSKCVFSYRPKARADLRPRGRWPSVRVDGPGDRPSVPRRSGLSGKPRVCDNPCGLPDPAAWVQSSRGRHASLEPDSNLVLEEVRPPDLILPSSRSGGAHAIQQVNSTKFNENQRTSTYIATVLNVSVNIQS